VVALLVVAFAAAEVRFGAAFAVLAVLTLAVRVLAGFAAALVARLRVAAGVLLAVLALRVVLAGVAATVRLPAPVAAPAPRVAAALLLLTVPVPVARVGAVRFAVAVVALDVVEAAARLAAGLVVALFAAAIVPPQWSDAVRSFAVCRSLSDRCGLSNGSGGAAPGSQRSRSLPAGASSC
jgi:hypothetical protein